jgi:hypothetical protein
MYRSRVEAAMRGWILGLACGCLALPLVARAQSVPRSDEDEKHLGRIDAYLQDAQNNARLLFALSELAPGTMDPASVREGVANLDCALANADRHLAELRASPDTRAAERPRLELLARDLGQARMQLETLRTLAGNPERIVVGDVISSVYQALQRADQDLGLLASSLGVPRIARIDPSVRRPVRGVDRANDLGSELDLMSPELRGRGFDSGLGAGNNVTPDHSWPRDY